MRRLVLAAAVLAMGGCASRALAPAERCHYSFTAPVTVEGDADCALTQDGELALALVAAPGRLCLSVADDASTGYARLEPSGTDRNLPGETYGKTKMLLDEQASRETCSTWEGHVAWDIAASGWAVEIISTCSSGQQLFLNGNVTSLQ